MEITLNFLINILKLIEKIDLNKTLIYNWNKKWINNNIFDKEEKIKEEKSNSFTKNIKIWNKFPFFT